MEYVCTKQKNSHILEQHPADLDSTIISSHKAGLSREAINRKCNSYLQIDSSATDFRSVPHSNNLVFVHKFSFLPPIQVQEAGEYTFIYIYYPCSSVK